MNDKVNDAATPQINMPNIPDWLKDWFKKYIGDILPDYNVGNDLAQKEYDFRYLVFPSDLGMSPTGHYMIININVPTVFFTSTPAGRYDNQFTPVDGSPTQRSKVDTLRFGNVGSGTPLRPGGAIPEAGGSQRPLVTIPRSTRRIKESIALHMPTPLVFTHRNRYEDISLTALAGKVGVSVGSFLPGKLGGLVGGLGKVLDPKEGSVIGDVVRLAGYPINPAIEVVFSTVEQRQFVMEVLMAPKNEIESKSLQAIIKTLRFHAAPELNSNTFGMTWIPPAEFDITFFNKGVENMHIVRMNTCLMESIEVDYAPSGTYSTFTNGHPVAVRLSMGFREVEPIHKLRILQNF